MRFPNALSLLSIGLVSAIAARAAPVKSDYVVSDLVAETTSIQPGQPFTVGLRLQLDEHWHVYWINPGDSGLAPQIEWTLPEGFSAGEIQWPRPELIPTDPFMTYGYEGEILLMVELTPPADLQPGTTATIGANASWLVCHDLCLPGKSSHTLELPVSPQAPQPNVAVASLFGETRELLPVEAGDTWNASFSLTDGSYELTINAPTGTALDSKGLYFFPFEEMVIEPSQPQETTISGNSISIRMVRSEYSDEVPPRRQFIEDHAIYANIDV
jgi:thiol:disulfide interchange protein DsbD